MLLLFLLHATVWTGMPGSENLPSLMTVDDYPKEAVRNGWQGLVRVGLTVGKNGRVRKCIVVRSSSHLSLDQATCRIFLTRARFKPARNAKGKPIEDYYETQITWRLE